MSKITVIDSLMGSGKTSWSIQYINEATEENFLYITPFLDEVSRVINNTEREFTQPINKGKGKLTAINDMLARQEDIAATHELFRWLNKDSREFIENGKYTLILDEVLSVLEPLNVKRDNLKILLESQCISIDKNGYVVWNPCKHEYDTDFNDLKMMADNHSLICVNGALLLWKYPPEIFELFDKIYILTYLFEASILHSYFDLHEIEYEYQSIKKENDHYDLVDYFKPDLSEVAAKMDIYEGKLNCSFTQKSGSLSKTWFTAERSKSDVAKLKNNLYNYIRNITNAKSDEVIWTTFKDAQSKLAGRGFTKRFIPCNCRSTNEFSNTSILAYCVNIYPHPGIINYLSQNNIYLDQDLYALSEMIQWIWRSRIRNGETIQIYVPSVRMRRLLYDWLEINKKAERKIID